MQHHTVHLPANENLTPAEITHLQQPTAHVSHAHAYVTSPLAHLQDGKFPLHTNHTYLQHLLHIVQQTHNILPEEFTCVQYPHAHLQEDVALSTELLCNPTQDAAHVQ